jgi:hypothetical protein
MEDEKGTCGTGTVLTNAEFAKVVIESTYKGFVIVLDQNFEEG